MTITIRTGEPGWSKTPHRLARDARLSNGARGLAVQLLSHADGFRSDEEFLVGCTADSRNEVRRQIAELRKYGYLVREKVRGADGKLATRSVLYDVPQATEPTGTDSPSRQHPARRSDLGKYAKPEQPPAATPRRAGTTSGNAKEPQAKPTRRTPASRSDQAKQDVVAGRTDSPYPGAHIEDQGDEQKKISQSAYRRQAVRQAMATYGLTEDEAVIATRIAEARCPKPGGPDNLAAYINGMDEGQMADIVAAVMDQAQREESHVPAPRQAQDIADEAEPSPAPFVPAVEPKVPDRPQDVSNDEAGPPVDFDAVMADLKAKQARQRTLRRTPR